MDDIKRQVADLIREIRKAKGLTQKELGERLGVDEGRVSRYESGKLNLTLSTVQEIFLALEAPLVLTTKK